MPDCRCAQGPAEQTLQINVGKVDILRCMADMCRKKTIISKTNPHVCKMTALLSVPLLRVSQSVFYCVAAH